MTAREPAIAARAANWLESMGLEVYEEVSVNGLRRADLVGVGPEALVVVECKLRLGLEVIDQADRWRPYCNASWCCVEGSALHHPRSKTARLGRWLCEQRGIGIVAVRPDLDRVDPHIVVPAPITEEPPRADELRSALMPEQRRGSGYAEAGTRGGYATPFKRTMALVSEIVSEHPSGIHVRDVLELVKERGGHHYRSDKGFCSSVPDVVKRGLVEGVKVRKTFGRKPTELVPVEGSS